MRPAPLQIPHLSTDHDQHSVHRAGSKSPHFAGASTPMHHRSAITPQRFKREYQVHQTFVGMQHIQHINAYVLVDEVSYFSHKV